MRLITYPAVFDDSQNGEKGYYTIEFPDLDTVFSEGHGLTQSLYNAEEALGLALEDIPDDELPKATPIEKVVEYCKKNYPNAQVYLIVSDLDKAKAETKRVMEK